MISMLSQHNNRSEDYGHHLGEPLASTIVTMRSKRNPKVRKSKIVIPSPSDNTIRIHLIQSLH